MKLEILKSGDAVEIHRQNEDGTKTVWICENDQAALFKLASLIFQQDEDPKQAKRSILVGTFGEKARKKKSLEDRTKEILDRLTQEGLEKVSEKESFDFGQIAPKNPFPAKPMPWAPGTIIVTPAPGATPYEIPMTGISPYSIPPGRTWIDVNTDGTTMFTTESGTVNLVDNPIQNSSNVFMTKVVYQNHTG